ncbi:MAG: site-specific integrase [Myxococcaceae bacterium]|nr:MAG: site-specific integrase [Myxococcaceae bacterium]
MASAYKDGRYWYASFKTASGRWRAVATRAATKSEAKRVAIELEQREGRIRHGLETALPSDGGGTVGDLLTWWLRQTANAADAVRSVYSVRQHFMSAPLSRLTLAQVRPEDIVNFLDERASRGGRKGGPLSPQTLNHLRGFLSRAWRLARQKGYWKGNNPLPDVAKRPVTRSLPETYLRPEEVPRVLAALHPRWRPLFATALYTGLRKGELSGLQRQDVDLERRLLFVGRSYDRDTTKGGHRMHIPLAEEALPFLRVALEQSPHPRLVFPGENGRMMAKQIALESVLRRALARAGIVEGYRHVCRRPRCRYEAQARNAELRRCPRCRMKLWPTPVVRPIRFHDMRHSTGALLTMAGASDATVRRVLRHKNPRMTEIYQHLSPEWLQTEVNRLRFGLPELLGLPSEPAARRAADPQRISATPERVPENESGTDGFFGMAGRNAAQHQTFEPSSPEGLDIMPLARTERTAAGHELSRRRSRVQISYSSLRESRIAAGIWCRLRALLHPPVPTSEGVP